MENALSPREIQTRIRAGATVEQVAQEMGVPTEQVEPFATPVLAERQHQVTTALTSPVRRRGETGSNRTLEAVVDERLRVRGLRADDVEWDAWRTEDRLWVVVGHYEVENADQDDRTHFEPQWRFDPRARFSTALNDDARWLIGELPPVGAPLRRRGGLDRGGMDPDAEPTVDLNDEMALVRATQDAAEMTIPLPASIRQHALDAEPPALGDRPQAPTPTVTVQVTEVAVVQESLPSTAPTSEDGLRQEPRRHGDAEGTGDEGLDARAPRPSDADADAGQASGEYGTSEYGEEYVDTELGQVDGVYDFVPSHTGNLDTLYEMLSGFQEDSVNIYAGLDQVPPVASDAVNATAQDGTPHTGEVQENAAAGENATDDTAADAAPEPATAPDMPLGDEPATVATGWPGTMGSEREPDTTLENPVETGPAQQSVGPETMAPEPEDPHNPEPRGTESTAPHGGDLAGAPDAQAGLATPATGSSDIGSSDTDSSDTASSDTASSDTGAVATVTPTRQDPISQTSVPEDLASRNPGAVAPAQLPGPQVPEQDALVEEPTTSVKPRPKNRKRASVPTWDEIMFGGPR